MLRVWGGRRKFSLNEDLFNDVKDADWQPVKREVGEITFKKVNQGKMVKRFLKTVSFILIAAVSGGASGAYIVEKKYANKIYPTRNTPLIVNIKDESSNTETVNNVISRIANVVGPAVVGISGKVEDVSGGKGSQGGSGIIFDSKGYIVTNNHVVQGSDIINVKLSNGKDFQAKCIGFDSKADIAVIKIEAINLPTVKFGNSERVKVGDVAVAIGNPLGNEFAGTVTAGIISGVNRRIKYDNGYYRLLQTDAAINFGNSGGPLCNEMGEVIGINSLNVDSTNYKSAEGVGSAISINDVSEVITRIMDVGKDKNNKSGEKGKIPKMGIVAEEVAYGKIMGIYVCDVDKEEGASAPGLKPADIITEVDNVKVTKIKELGEALSHHQANNTIVCKVYRDGKTIEVTVNLS